MNRPVVLDARSLAVFPDNYRQARDSMLALARACPLVDEGDSRVLEGRQGAEAETLTTELFWLGPRAAENVVVLVSATHGVEGFVGAAVQADLLLRIEQGYRLPANTAVLIIFALNPWGFSYCRRCDESGIDLNRNFIDFDSALPENPGYERLREAIYLEDTAQRHRLFEDYRRQYGQTAYEVAISGGQYSDPSGPFYGGRAAAHGRRVIEQTGEHYGLAGRQLAVIDLHSGLGPYGYGEIINDHPVDSAGFRVANRWYGASVTAPATGNSSSVIKLGLHDYYWHGFMAERGSFVTLEYGSFRTQDLFDVVLEDHRSWKARDADAIARSARAMKQHFCPADAYWRELVLVKARQVIQQAVDGLCDE